MLNGLLRWKLNGLLRWKLNGLLRWKLFGLLRWKLNGLLRWKLFGLLRRNLNALLGVGTNGCKPVAPPSESGIRFSRTGLSSWWFYLREDCIAEAWAADKEISPRSWK